MSKIIGYLFIGIVKLYQYLVSPLLPTSCRYTPTCSVYSVDAIKKHGPFKGGWMALKRISRCHPWGTNGFDPVPPK